jgi:predicted nucleic acid-binding Zn ribbon protein
MTLEDRYLGIMNDPAKRARAFKIIMIVSYSMLMLGAVLVVWTLAKGL